MHGGGSTRSFLRFIPLRTLTVTTSDPLDMQGLNGLGVEKLDLGTSPISLTQEIWLPNLKEIHLSPQSISPAKLRRLIKSSQSFAITKK